MNNSNKLEMQIGKLNKRKCIYAYITASVNVFVNHFGNKVSVSY